MSSTLQTTKNILVDRLTSILEKPKNDHDFKSIDDSIAQAKKCLFILASYF